MERNNPTETKKLKQKGCRVFIKKRCYCVLLHVTLMLLIRI